MATNVLTLPRTSEPHAGFGVGSPPLIINGWASCIWSTALLFFLLGGLEALIIRTQLASPNNTLVTPDLYNQLFTMHGTTMIFLGGHAAQHRLWQLYCAADDRRRVTWRSPG